MTPRNSPQMNWMTVGIAPAEVASEDITEVRRVVLEEVPMNPEKTFLHLKLPQRRSKI